MHSCRCINIIIAEPSISQEEQSSFNLTEGVLARPLLEEPIVWIPLQQSNSVQMLHVQCAQSGTPSCRRQWSS